MGRTSRTKSGPGVLGSQRTKSVGKGRFVSFWLLDGVFIGNDGEHLMRDVWSVMRHSIILYINHKQGPRIVSRGFWKH